VDPNPSTFAFTICGARVIRDVRYVCEPSLLGLMSSITIMLIMALKRLSHQFESG
jgi:hypothetical protein